MILLNLATILGNTFINVSRNSDNRETVQFALDIGKIL